MRKLRKKVITSSLIAAMLAIGTCISASALAHSDWTTTGKINGYSYSYRASLSTNSGSATAYTTIKTSNGAYPPGGYMGAQARLYNANDGTLTDCNEMYYENNSTNSVTDTITVAVRGTSYSQGLVAICYDAGNHDYHIWATEPTTYGSSYSMSQTNNIPDDYEINKSGETYGSGLMYSECNEFPDLISAEGINGVIGYVRNDDLVKTPKDLEDSQTGKGRYVPVYDLNGNQVDLFYVSPSNSNTAVSGNLLND